MNEFLVELYVPWAVQDGARHLITRAQRAARELTTVGKSVRFVRSIFVPADKTCLFLYEAASIDDVREAARRATLPFDRVLETAPASNLTLEDNR